MIGDGDSGRRKVRVVIVDDQTIFREMLAEILVADRYDVVAQLRTGEEAIARIPELMPDLVVLDVMLPDRSGIDVLRELVRLRPPPRVVMVTAYEQSAVVREAVAAGAHGLVMKGTPLRELKAGLARVAEGSVYFCPTTSELLRKSALDPAPASDLTARERQIVRMVAAGASSKEIGAALGISEKTVQNHRTNIMNKLGIRDVAGLTRFAIARGLVPPEA